MSFTITLNGHAGNGMEGNSPEEIEAVRSVQRAIREVCQRQNLTVGSLTVNPPDWAEKAKKEH